jgi:hypothetical protein
MSPFNVIPLMVIPSASTAVRTGVSAVATKTTLPGIASQVELLMMEMSLLTS